MKNLPESPVTKIIPDDGFPFEAVYLLVGKNNNRMFPYRQFSKFLGLGKRLFISNTSTHDDIPACLEDFHYAGLLDFTIPYFETCDSNTINSTLSAAGNIDLQGGYYFVSAFCSVGYHYNTPNELHKPLEEFIRKLTF